MRTISTSNSPTSSLAVAPTASSATALCSPWHSPLPYLFGGLAAMLGLIAFALLILACSYWKHSSQLQNEGGGGGEDLESGGRDSAEKESAKVYEEKILVIMAGDEKPTFLATPVGAKSSSFGDEIRKDFDREDENNESYEKLEKEMDNHVHATIPREDQGIQATQQQNQ